MKRGGTTTSKHQKKNKEKSTQNQKKYTKEPQKKILELSKGRCGRARPRTISPLKPLNELNGNPKGPKDGRNSEGA